MVAAISDVQEVSRRHRDPKRLGELSRGSGAAVAAEAGDASPCDGGDDPVPIYAANPVIVRVGEVEIPGRVKGNPVGVVELGGKSRPTVPAEATAAGSSDDRYGPILPHSD